MNRNITEAEIQAFAASKGLDPEVVRSQLRTLRSQTYNEDVMYYSRVRFKPAETTAAGPPATMTYDFAPAELAAFSYGNGQPIPQAGFGLAVPAAIQATFADTNLIKAGETNGGENLVIKGISLRLGATSDPLLWALLSEHMSLRIRMDNKDKYLIGTAGDVPHLCSLPLGQSLNTPTTTTGERGMYVPPETPTRLYPQGYMPFTRPIRWTSGGQTDSTLNVMLQLHQATQFVVTERSAGEATCCVGYSVPDKGDPGTYCDVWVRLHGHLEAARSANQ
jgi:hypothetical protein